MSLIWSGSDDSPEPRWFRVVGNLALVIMLAYSLYVMAIWLTGGDV